MLRQWSRQSSRLTKTFCLANTAQLKIPNVFAFDKILHLSYKILIFTTVKDIRYGTATYFSKEKGQPFVRKTKTKGCYQYSQRRIKTTIVRDWRSHQWRGCKTGLRQSANLCEVGSPFGRLCRRWVVHIYIVIIIPRVYKTHSSSSLDLSLSQLH